MDSLEYYRFGSGKTIIGEALRKCSGLKAVISEGSSVSAKIGWEFRTSSIWSKTIVNCLKENRCVPAIRLKLSLKTFTAQSHKPPIWGACGGINCHSKRWVEYLPVISVGIKIVFLVRIFFERRQEVCYKNVQKKKQNLEKITFYLTTTWCLI